MNIISKTKSARAALIHEYGGVEQFRLEDIQIGNPGPDEILVRVAAAAVNPFDIVLRKGYMHDFVPLTFPACIGGDLSGIVEAIGENVIGFAPGDRVMGMLANGAYAELVVAKANQFTIVPDRIDLVHAAALPMGVMTGIQLIEKGLKPVSGMKILVTGAGGSVGRAAVFAALDADAIVYAGIRAGSEDAVKDLPVAGVIDLSDDSALQTAGPFDYIADTVGGVVAEQLFAHLSPEGYFASVVMPVVEPPVNFVDRFALVIVEFDGPRLQRFAHRLVEKGREMPISVILDLAEVAKAHSLLEQGGLRGKIILKA